MSLEGEGLLVLHWYNLQVILIYEKKTVWLNFRNVLWYVWSLSYIEWSWEEVAVCHKLLGVCLLHVTVMRLHKAVFCEAFRKFFICVSRAIYVHIESVLLLPRSCFNRDKSQLEIWHCCGFLQETVKIKLAAGQPQWRKWTWSLVRLEILPGECVTSALPLSICLCLPVFQTSVLQWLDGFSSSQLFLTALILVFMSCMICMLFI